MPAKLSATNHRIALKIIGNHACLNGDIYEYADVRRSIFAAILIFSPWILGNLGNRRFSQSQSIVNMISAICFLMFIIILVQITVWYPQYLNTWLRLES